MDPTKINSIMPGFYRLLSLLIMISCISSCGKCPCVDSDIYPGFIGFDPSDVDTVIISKYSKNNNFTTLIDTVFFDDKSSFEIQKTKDTISFPYRPGNFSINKNYDWVLFLPSINRTFKISDIVSPQVSLSCPSKVQCVNPINSLNINGVTSTPIYFNFYLKK